MDASIVAYLINNLIMTLAVERFMSGFFEKRKSSLARTVASYAAFYVSMSTFFLLLGIPLLMIVVNNLMMFVIALNYEAKMLKRVFAVLGIYLVLVTVEVAFVMFIGLYMPSMLEQQAEAIGAGIVWGFIAVGLITHLLALIFRRLKHIGKNTIELPWLFWASSLLVPAVSIVMQLWVIVHLPQVISVLSLAALFLINMLTFYLHDTLSAVYEDKLVAMKTVGERMQAMIDSSPLACALIDEEYNIIEVNERVARLFELSDKADYIHRQQELSAQFQPDGNLSSEKYREIIIRAFRSGRAHCEWMCRTLSGLPIPCELTLERVQIADKPLVICYIHDLREIRSLISTKDHLERLAFTDSLTGLYNRRYFLETAQAELQNEKQEMPLSIAMLDLDFFKNINDRHGHTIGDEVLKIFAARVKQVLRHGALVARYGGEEFVVLLTNADANDAFETARRIHENIGKLPFVIGDLSIDVTASIGIATYTGADESLIELIDKADAAMYRAKAVGRNTIVSHAG